MEFDVIRSATALGGAVLDVEEADTVDCGSPLKRNEP
jgi:hypothetical protein